jgi:RNA-dependent RNA polymerase
MTIGCKISAEIIVNLAENGVPIDVFKALVKQAHDEEIELWTGFDRPDYAIRLRSHIMRSSNIVQSRMARSCEGSARAFGLRRFDRPSEPLRAGALIEDDENADENENDDDDDGIRAKVGQSDPFSGQPCSIGEVVIEALDAGFRPHNTPTLYSLMQLLAKLSIQQWAQAPKFSLSVPLSCSGLFVPGKCSALKTRREILMNDA